MHLALIREGPSCWGGCRDLSTAQHGVRLLLFLSSLRLVGKLGCCLFVVGEPEMSSMSAGMTMSGKRACAHNNFRRTSPAAYTLGLRCGFAVSSQPEANGPL